MRRCAVTGGCGFIGRFVIEKLLAEDPRVEIVCLDSDAYVHSPIVYPSTTTSLGGDITTIDGDKSKRDSAAEEACDTVAGDRVTSVVGCITKLGDVVSAINGCDSVVHCMSGDPLDELDERLMRRINVDGTKNVIEACKQCRVSRLVYVSAASVVFSGAHLFAATEQSQPIASASVLDNFLRTKAAAERLVIKANRPGSLATVTLRPAAVFGERDPSFLPAFIAAARYRSTKFIIGNGTNVWDLTYVGNVAHACVLALRQLSPSPSKDEDKSEDASEGTLAGEAYFITNNEPVPVWKFIGRLLRALNYDYPVTALPFYLCYMVAYFLEVILFIIRPIYRPKRHPGLSRTRVRTLAASRTFSCEKAKAAFGYEPQVSLDEAAERTIDYFKIKDKNA